MKDLIYLHGFASDKQAYKANFLRDKLKDYPGVVFHRPNFNPSPADFKYKTITGMIARLREFILAKELINPYIIASSLSGVVALNYAKRYEKIAALLLLAPMLRYFRLFSQAEDDNWRKNGFVEIETSFAKNTYLSYGFAKDAQNYQNAVAPPANTVIIHGQYDETIPFAESKHYAQEYGLELIALNSQHSLSDSDSLERIWQETKNLVNIS